MDEPTILSFYDKPDHKIIAIYRGEDAWKHILKIRYQAGSPRAHMKRLWRNYTKIDSILVIFTDTEFIYAHYYLDKYDTENTGEDEGSVNMFSSFYLDSCPPLLQKLMSPTLRLVNVT